MSLPKLLSVRAASEETTIPASTLYDLVARDEIPSVRIGRSIRIPEEDLVAWIERRRREQR